MKYTKYPIYKGLGVRQFTSSLRVTKKGTKVLDTNLRLIPFMFNQNFYSRQNKGYTGTQRIEHGISILINIVEFRRIMEFF